MHAIDAACNGGAGEGHKHQGWHDVDARASQTEHAICRRPCPALAIWSPGAGGGGASDPSDPCVDSGWGYP